MEEQKTVKRINWTAVILFGIAVSGLVSYDYFVKGIKEKNVIERQKLEQQTQLERERLVQEKEIEEARLQAEKEALEKKVADLEKQKTQVAIPKAAPKTETTANTIKPITEDPQIRIEKCKASSEPLAHKAMIAAWEDYDAEAAIRKVCETPEMDNATPESKKNCIEIVLDSINEQMEQSEKNYYNQIYSACLSN